MNELKEQIDKIIGSSAQKSFGDGTEPLCNGWERLHTPTLRKDLMQLIETYTAKKELEARIYELKRILYGRTQVTHLMDFGEIERRLKLLDTQLSSQLTNNKEEV